MWHSTTKKGQKTADPEHIRVEELHDESTGMAWLRVIWYGDGYDDAWFVAEKSAVVTLDDKI